MPENNVIIDFYLKYEKAKRTFTLKFMGNDKELGVAQFHESKLGEMKAAMDPEKQKLFDLLVGKARTEPDEAFVRGSSSTIEDLEAKKS